MTKLASTLGLVILGLVVLAATSRALIALAGALQPLLAVGCIVVALLRCIWWWTGPR